MVSSSSMLQAVLAAQQTSHNITALFGPSLSPGAEILLPEQPDFYGQLQQRWTDYNAPRYSIGAIKPATEADVQHIVAIAAEHDIPFFATGGGHGIADYGSFDGLSIDMGHFKSVQIDEDSGRLTIGGAVKIHQLVKPLYEARKELPLGSCACVGVVGATLGGGIGSLHGHRGLMLDSLESVRMVTADGKLLDVSEYEHSDLFWAIRGAGSNFGIVTSATYRVPEASNDGMYMNADFVYPASANQSFWKIMQDYDDYLPAPLAITAVAFYNRVTNQPLIGVNAIYFGPQKEGEPFVEPFKRLGPTMSNISMVPGDGYMDAAFFRFFGGDNGACTPNQHINIYTIALKQTHAPTFESFFGNLTKFWEDNPDYQGRLLMQRYPNDGPSMVPDDATAFPYRDVKTFMNIEGFYSETDLDDVVNAFSRHGRDQFAQVSGFKSLAAYSNYARGDEGPEAWYSERKLPRLSALKRKYDPDARFSANCPVPRYWPSADRITHKADL